MLHAKFYYQIIVNLSCYSPDAEIENVKCSDYIDEVIPDGLGASDDEDGNYILQCTKSCLYDIV